MPARSARVQFWVAAGLWLAATLYTWPVALSFADEVGYVGSARLLASGRARPAASDPGFWLAAPEGRVAKFPYAFSLLLLPLASSAPRALFAIGVAAALGLALLARDALLRRRLDPRWALLFLAHPTFVLLGRTVMADVLLSLLALAAFIALQRQAAGRALALFAALCLLKPTGFVIAGGLLAGDLAGLRYQAPGLREPRRRAALAAGAGIATGGAGVTALNLLAHGTPYYAYLYVQGTPPLFDLYYLASSGLAHAISLALCPPLLLLGLWPFVRDRELGPVFAVIALCALMSVYFFVDHGRGFLDSLVLGQRLILPAVAFLLLGYARGLAELTARSARLRPALALWLVLPACSALAVGLAHRRYQEPMARALAAAEREALRLETDALGTSGAAKTALMFPGRVVAVGSAEAPPARVVLCAASESYRSRYPSSRSCALPGFEVSGRFGPLTLLRARQDRTGAP